MLKDQCAALVELYDKKIMICFEAIFHDKEKYENFKGLLPRFKIERLIESSENAEEFSNKLFKKLQASDMVKIDDERLYREILAFLHKYMTNSSLHKQLRCVNEKTRRSQFGLILSNLDGFLKYIEPDAVISYLRAIPAYDETIQRLIPKLERIDQENQDEQTEDEQNKKEMEKKKMILRSVPQLGTFAVLDILFTIYEHGSQSSSTEARHFVDSIFKLKSGEFLNHFKTAKGEQSIVVCDVDVLASDMMLHLGLGDLPSGLRSVNYRFDRIANYSTRRTVLNSIDPCVQTENPIILRNYQDELCRLAIESVNTIITAPTGTGKTVVAAKIIKHHFEVEENKEQRFKALFMTPNTTILHQQADKLKHYLGHAYNIRICQGSDNTSVRGAVLSNDVVVATPQMIVNLCNEHDDELSEFSNEKFYLSTFTIIVFDECHSTVNNSPYANIMREYHNLKNMGTVPDGQHLPQIVGLTASLGVGKIKDNEVEHIANMCSTLDVNKISTVQEYKEDLKNYSPIIPEQIDFFPKSTDGPSRDFAVSVMKLMDKVFGLMNDAFANVEEFIKVSDGGKAELPQKDHTKFLNWLSVTKRNLAETNIRGDRNKINEAIQVLEHCYRTLCYNSNFNPKTAWTFLEDNIRAREPYFTEEMKGTLQAFVPRLQKLSQNVLTENPMILKIESYIVENNQGNPNSRTIVFVQTRYEAITLKKILSENQNLQRLNIKTDWIFGLNRNTEGSEESTASRSEQLEKLAQFSNGTVRVLVSTSVAEEGLDVSACNLVIKYNYSTNEIAHVQRRGRGRASDSKSILITNDESLRKQELANMEKEKQCEKAIQLAQENISEFQRMINRKSDEIWPRLQSERTEKIRIDRMLELKNSTYRIVCRKCDGLVCTSQDISSRLDSMFLVCNPEFWKIVVIQPVQPNAYTRGSILHASPNCGAQIGQLVVVPGCAEMPVLGAKNIILIDMEDGKRSIVNQWKEIRTMYFKPKRVTEREVTIMRDARLKKITFEVSGPDGRNEISYSKLKT
ncbi:hypothetical protein B9Z55_013595 [Caenorhabditis nigoni]|uniref:RNA helicase n=1 Tax=Caenorhabditis nigoni TaxID=1611254 RepID=A0A2G5U2E4_9PELO|nr:hypothetical protein B9Z55_013595 [Caenorhabditis nigoni]